MYHPSDLAAMDPLVLMKNLDHVRMTSRRLSYVLQQQSHLYTPEANDLREQIDRYVEAERQIEGEMAQADRDPAPSEPSIRQAHCVRRARARLARRREHRKRADSQARERGAQPATRPASSRRDSRIAARTERTLALTGEGPPFCRIGGAKSAGSPAVGDGRLQVQAPAARGMSRGAGSGPRSAIPVSVGPPSADLAGATRPTP